jgi:hypothetical protein
LDRYSLKSVDDEAGARRPRQCCCKRAVFFAVGAGEQRDLAQVIFRLLAVALFELPQPVISLGLDVVGVGLQRALIPDLRKLVVAELAIGIADQIGDRRGVVVAERLQLLDRGSVVVAVVDRGVGRVIAVGECRVFPARADLAGLLPGLGLGRNGRGLGRSGRGRRIAIRRGLHRTDDRRGD